MTGARIRTPTVGTALRLTYRAFARDLARRLAPHGVTLLMWFVLRELWKRDGLSQSEIAGATDRQASAIVSVVRALQEAGLVRVTRSARDGRRSVVRLTGAGRKLEPVLTAHGRTLSQTAQRGFTAVEKRALMDMLARLRRNIDRNGAAVHEVLSPIASVTRSRIGCARLKGRAPRRLTY